MIEKGKKISSATIKRLPIYLRVLKEFKNNGIMRTSSQKIAEEMRITASQVRQDFWKFDGQFGQQGYGYDTEHMIKEITQIIGLDKTYNMVIFGVGNLGRALANYKAFHDDGFHIIAAFDVEGIGNQIDELKVKDINEFEEFAKLNKIDIAIITVPKSKAEEILLKIKNAKIRNVWNFAPIKLSSNNNTVIENINMIDSLYVLSYKINNK